MRRREYWALFNDFTGRTDGLMTTLPMELFSLFEFTSGKAFALEVFVALVLFCSGDWDSKGKVLFTMFDMSKRDSLQLVGRASRHATNALRLQANDNERGAGRGARVCLPHAVFRGCVSRRVFVSAV